MENYIDDSRIHEGHRGRMRAKLLSHGQRIFDTYELLEMLLYQVIPYRDTNPIAKRLLNAFCDLDGVLSATPEELTICDGVGIRTAEFLTDVGRLCDVIGAETICNYGPDMSSYDSVGRYVAEYFKDVKDKQVISLYLDNSMRLKCLKKLYDLEFESGGVKPKPFIDGAIENSATVVITAHNHPYGPFYPTLGDRATHEAITAALDSYGIIHAEHYIVSGDYYAGIGSLQNFTAKLSQAPALSRFFESRDGASDSHRLSAVSPINSTVTEELGYNRIDMEYFKRLLAYLNDRESDRLAEELLTKYHTIENVFTATVREISAIGGEKLAFYIKLLAFVTSRRRTDKIKPGRAYTKAEIADYLKALYIGESVEKTYLIGYDKKGRFLGCELIGEGTVGASEIMPRKAVDTASVMAASSVSIAHNHPFGTTRASSDDVNVTKLFTTLFGNCDIDFKEHFIVAGQLCDTIDF